MSFSPTFGSFGDFISLGILIRDVVNAIDDTHGSAAEYRSLAAQLEITGAMLKEAQRLCESHTTVSNVQLLNEMAKKVVDSCQADLTLFEVRLLNYKSALGDGNGGFAKRTSRKVMWLMEKHTIKEFRAKLGGLNLSLNIILSMANKRTLEANEESRNNDASTWAESGRIIVRSIQNLSDTLLRKVGQIAMMNMYFYQEMRDRLTTLESRIERPIPEEVFTFEDAIGRPSVMHLSSVNSWEAFDALLMVNFNGHKGSSRVARKRYTLQDHRRKRDIPHNIPWPSAMLPGSQVYMSIICSSSPGSEDGSAAGTSCPSCFSTSAVATHEGTRCAACNLIYTRITEVEDVDVEPPRKKRKANKTRDACVQSIEVDESDDEDAKGFTRVQLIAKQKRIKRVTNRSDLQRDATTDKLSTPFSGQDFVRKRRRPARPAWTEFDKNGVPREGQMVQLTGTTDVVKLGDVNSLEDVLDRFRDGAVAMKDPSPSWSPFIHQSSPTQSFRYLTLAVELPGIPVAA
ncbi:hypothetical protein PGQ11_000067 [Apiospora arundinis]